MPVEPRDYRDLLRAELELRKKKNRAYSLRAFAQDIGISNAFLSQILRGLRGLGEDRAAALAARLGWSRAQTQIFISLVRFENLKDASQREQCLADLQWWRLKQMDFSQVSLATFSKIATWYHSAILELTSIADFRVEVESVARQLGIHARQARQALRDLTEVGLLREERGRWVKEVRNTRIPSAPSHVLRAYHLQLLQRARLAIEHHPIDSRRYGGVTMAIDPDLLPEAERRISEFRKELMVFLESGNRRAVYQLSTLLFRLDRDEKPGDPSQRSS